MYVPIFLLGMIVGGSIVGASVLGILCFAVSYFQKSAQLPEPYKREESLLSKEATETAIKPVPKPVQKTVTKPVRPMNRISGFYNNEKN